MSSCIICDSSRNKTAIQFPDYSVIECLDCQFGIVEPIPSQEKLDQLYNSKEYYNNNMFYNFDTITKEEIEKLIKKNRELHIGDVRKYIKPNQKFLEIGCGGGFALKAFQNEGLEVLGVETSAVAKEFAERTFNIKVINTSIEDFSSDQKFDIILLNHVLEHFLDPNAAMQKLTSLLNKGGILYIRVPDHDSYDRKVYGKKWPAYAHYHISNFSAASLTTIFKKNNLEVLEVKKYISETIKSKLIRKIIYYNPFRKALINRFNGRTITIIGRKQ